MLSRLYVLPLIAVFTSPAGFAMLSKSSLWHSNPHYKTEMCKHVEKGEACPFGTSCQFAHSLDEVQVRTYPANYRTQLCWTFTQYGKCPYGKRCHFRHDPELLLNSENIRGALVKKQVGLVSPVQKRGVLMAVNGELRRVLHVKRREGDKRQWRAGQAAWLLQLKREELAELLKNKLWLSAFHVSASITGIPFSAGSCRSSVQPVRRADDVATALICLFLAVPDGVLSEPFFYYSFRQARSLKSSLWTQDLLPDEQRRLHIGQEVYQLFFCPDSSAEDDVKKVSDIFRHLIASEVLSKQEAEKLMDTMSESISTHKSLWKNQGWYTELSSS